MNAFLELSENIDYNTSRITFVEGKNQTAIDKAPGTIIVVVGESANRDRMKAFNSVFPYETTPWESQIKENRNFVFNDIAYSNYSNTIISLSMALTSANQYNGQSLKDAVSIVDIAKKAGYSTYWYSTQHRSSVFNAALTVIADRTDSVIALRGHDSVLVDSLEKIPQDKNNFVIIHINGSHFRYDYQYPSSFPKKHEISKQDPYREYDYSLMYTDEVLQHIFDYSQKYLNLQAMVYFSDHGEDMKNTHAAPPFYYSMIRIPLWVYLSPQYQRAYPTVMANLKEHSHTVFTNDLVFDTLCGILQAKTNFYDSRFDLASPNYFLTMVTAKSMGGKVYIADDPDL